jgi:hypothetical protein
MGLPASSAGTALIPVVMATVVGAVLAGRVMYMVDRYKWATIVGLAFSVCAVAVLATSPGELPLALIEVLLATTSLGIGTAVPVTISAIQNVVAPHQLGSATASYNFFRQLAGALAVAAFGAVVFGGDAHAGLSPHGLTYQAIQVSGAEFLQRFRLAFAMMAVTLSVAVVMILLMEERPLRGDQPDGAAEG